jgi:hypothetical protein
MYKKKGDNFLSPFGILISIDYLNSLKSNVLTPSTVILP